MTPTPTEADVKAAEAFLLDAGDGRLPEELAQAFAAHRERERETWSTAWATAREAILHERGPLAEEGAGPDVINAVLAILDDNEPAYLQPPTEVQRG